MVAVAAVLSGALSGTLLLARDAGLATFGYDQAFFQQLVWNLDHGRWFVSSFTSGSFLGLHFSPLLVVPAAVELLWADPRALSLLAALSIAAFGPSAFLLLRAMGVRPGLAAALAAPLPLWPAAQQAVRAGFHPETLGIDLTLLAGAAGLRGRPLPCVALAVLALCAREDQAWNVLVIGLVLATSPGARRLGSALAVAAVAWGATIAGVVMPALRAGRAVDTDSYYRWLQGASVADVVHALAQPRGWLAAGAMVACAGCLPLLRPAWLALALPPFLADLLSAHAPQPSLGLQYALPLIVPVLVAAGAAARAPNPLRGQAALAALPALAIALVTGPLPPAIGADPRPFQRPPALAALERCAAAIPADAPVAADDTLTVRLASRPVIRELTGAAPGDSVVVDRQAPPPGYVTARARAGALAGLRSDGRPVLCDDGRFVVMGPIVTAAHTCPSQRSFAMSEVQDCHASDGSTTQTPAATSPGSSACSGSAARPAPSPPSCGR